MFFAQQGQRVAQINVKFAREGSAPPCQFFHVYRGNNVGIQPPQTVESWNFRQKFVPLGRLVCTIFTKFSAFVGVYR